MAITPPPIVELSSKAVSPNSWRELLRRRLPAWIAILAIFSIVYLGALASPPIFDDADATHAEAAREMVVSHDWVTPHVDGVRYLFKPPLPFWLVAASYRIFGVSAGSTRLPTALTIFLLMLLAADWARRAFGGAAAIFASLMVTTTIGFFLFTRIFIPDALLALTISGALYFALLALERGHASRWLWYASYASLALAVLAKGLVAIVFVVAALAAYFAITGEWRRWREFHLFSGTLIFLLIAAPWHILAGIRNQGFFWLYFVNEHWLRFLGKRYPKDYNKLPAIAYWTLHFVWLFPWSLFLARVVENLRNRARERDPEVWTFADRTRLLCLLWSGMILVFFAISTNQEYYTFPAYIPLLLLAADALASERTRSRWSTLAYWLISILGLAAAIALAIGLWSSRNLPVPADIGSVLADRQVASNTLSMSKFFDLTGAAFAGLRLPALLAAVAFGIGPLIALLWHRRSQRVAIWTLGVTTAVFLVAAQVALVRFGPFMSSRKLAEAIRQQMRPDSEVMIYGDQAFGSSLVFYLQRQVLLVNGKSTTMLFGSQYPDCPPIFLTDADLLNRWKKNHRDFLLVTPEYREQATRALAGQPVYEFAEVSGKIILSNLNK